MLGEEGEVAHAGQDRWAATIDLTAERKTIYYFSRR
jgi:hypothetical protein